MKRYVKVELRGRPTKFRCAEMSERDENGKFIYHESLPAGGILSDLVEFEESTFPVIKESIMTRDLNKELQANIKLIEKAGGKFNVDAKISTELNLSKAIFVCESMNLKEDAPKKTLRNNGGSRQITEASTVDLKEQVERMRRSYGMSVAETLFMLKPRVDTYGLSESQIRESWTPYADILTGKEIDGLVLRRVGGPKK
jgi:hypothetical protein